MGASLPQLILPIKLERSPERLGLEAVPDAGIREFARSCEAVLPESCRTATVATLRWKLYRLAAKLARHARGWRLQIKAGLEKWRLLASARLSCAALAG